jgi:SH3-like domain-containing protein
MKNAIYDYDPFLHLEAAKRLLPVKRGPTVKKIILWLYLGRGLNAEVADSFTSWKSQCS